MTTDAALRVTLWGTRGSLATPGPETARYGGNTSCVALYGREGTVLVLDAGTGIRRAGRSLAPNAPRVDVLLTHLHMDHVQGLGFFAPLYRPGCEVHIWGPASATMGLKARLNRYLSPPLFPVHLNELPCRLFLHEVPCGEVEIGEFIVSAGIVCHPGPTVGYRIVDARGKVVTYIPDHEPALGAERFPSVPAAWTSGAQLCERADALIHDSQYSSKEYPRHVGWGHSSLAQAMNLGTLCQIKRLISFHHDPNHNDADIDTLIAESLDEARPQYEVVPGCEGMTVAL